MIHHQVIQQLSCQVEQCLHELMTLLCHVNKGSISDGSAVVILRVVDGLFGSLKPHTQVLQARALHCQGLKG